MLPVAVPLIKTVCAWGSQGKTIRELRGNQNKNREPVREVQSKSQWILAKPEENRNMRIKRNGKNAKQE